MIVASTCTLVDKFKAKLREHVEITDLGELHWLLGIEIQRDRPGRLLHLSQWSYIDAILCRFGFEDLKPVSILMDTQVSLLTAQSPRSTSDFAMMRNIPYCEAVGSLMYLALATQPNISFAISVVLHFTSNPGVDHWNAVKHVFRYLKGMQDQWLTCGIVSGRDKLQGYADADGSMVEDQHAISGYAFLLDGGAVSWSSK